MSEWLRALLSIAAVLALAAALRCWIAPPAWWRGRRRPAGRGEGRLETLDRVVLSPQHTLHLVRVGDRALLIGSHPAGCSLLESLPAEALRAAAPVPEEQ
jgi:flagellar biogenesis protein FliO